LSTAVTGNKSSYDDDDHYHDEVNHDYDYKDTVNYTDALQSDSAHDDY
jgi:hypothetical protein